MAIKELKKTVKVASIENEKEVENFIAKGGSLVNEIYMNDEHRITIRIPKWLMEKIDIKRKERIGKVSRNLWILELIEKEIKS